MAKKQWRCFYCDEVFTNEFEAALHFGAKVGGAGVACKITGDKYHILRALRAAEYELARRMNEDSDLDRAYYALEAEKVVAVRKAEEEGYARGVRDMKAQGYCAEPKAHK